MIRVPLSDLAPGERALDSSQARYVSRVHRLRAGDRFIAFDGRRALECDAEVLSNTAVRLGEPRPAAVRAPREVTWIHGVPKADKADAIVRDATELGATRIVLVPTERSVSRPKAARAERWTRIAEQAARQCGRGDVPAVSLGADWPSVLRSVDAQTRVCLDPHGGPLRDALVSAKGALAFAVGPEGGLAPVELELATSSGFTRCSLGGLVMRTETVPAAVLGAVAFLL